MPHDAQAASAAVEVPKLKLWTAISIVVGCVIGSGVFVKPGRVLVATGSSTQAVWAWVLGGLITLAGGLTLAEVAFRIPKTGGVYVYVEELYGRTPGFVCGWVQSLIYGPALMSALSLYFGSLFAQFFGLDLSMQKPIALLTLFFLVSVTVFSTIGSAWIQNIATAVKLVPIALIAVFGLLWGHEPVFGSQLADQTATTGMGAAILSALWAYDGWVNVANMADELDQPAKNLPRAFVIGLSSVMVVYVLVNLALFHVLPAEQIGQLNERSAGVASEQLFGGWGGKLISLGILISIFGCLNGNILTSTRVPYAMATRGAFPYPRVFGRLHPKYATPLTSIVFMTVCAVVMIVLLNPDRITDIAIFSMYLFYCAVFFGIFKVRKIHGKPARGQYQVPLYPVVPVLAIAGGAFICYSMARQSPLDALVSVGIALVGVPVFKGLRKQA